MKVSPIDGMEQVYVPDGEFLMGSSQGEADVTWKESGHWSKAYFDAEVPLHKVYLDAFWIDKTEVTNGMYQKCVGFGACKELENKGSRTRDDYYGNREFTNYPVGVDWNQAKTYCEWAGGRLLTEAEWEKAARGTDGQKYPWGNSAPDSGRANYGGGILGDLLLGDFRYCKIDMTQVGSYPEESSPYGALDMAGNEWEWVNDWYAENYYQSSAQKNPTGADSGELRVLRGGSWNNGARNVRAALRLMFDPDYGINIGGFRCVR